MVLFPGVEHLLNIFVDVSGVNLTEKCLSVLLHLLGGDHSYKLNINLNMNDINDLEIRNIFLFVYFYSEKI